MNNQQPSQRKKHPFSLAHRWSGITAAVIIILVSMTGMALNHADDLRLAQRNVSTSWLLSWYGVAAPGEPISYTAGDQVVSQLDDYFYVDGGVIGERKNTQQKTTLRGAVLLPQFLVIAAQDQLLLFTDGELVETLSAVHGLPADIRRIGKDASDALIIEYAEGLLSPDDEFLAWESVEAQRVAWSAPRPTPEKIAVLISQHYRGDGLSLERIMLDLHSGRILGAAGPWIADVLSLLLILLASTGIWMWFKSRKR